MASRCARRTPRTTHTTYITTAHHHAPQTTSRHLATTTHLRTTHHSARQRRRQDRRAGAERGRGSRCLHRRFQVCKGIRDERVHLLDGTIPLVLLDSCSADETRAFWAALGGEPAGGVAPAVPDTDGADQEIAASTQLWRLSEVVADGGRKKLQITEVTQRPLVRGMLDPVRLLASPTNAFLAASPLRGRQMHTTHSRYRGHSPRLYCQSGLTRGLSHSP